MKPTLILAIAALTGCSAFTAPRDPVTGIRQDAPAHWADTLWNNTFLDGTNETL
jgi:hypothetical protein